MIRIIIDLSWAEFTHDRESLVTIYRLYFNTIFLLKMSNDTHFHGPFSRLSNIGTWTLKKTKRKEHWFYKVYVPLNYKNAPVFTFSTNSAKNSSTSITNTCSQGKSNIWMTKINKNSNLWFSFQTYLKQISRTNWQKRPLTSIRTWIDVQMPAIMCKRVNLSLDFLWQKQVNLEKMLQRFHKYT